MTLNPTTHIATQHVWGLTGGIGSGKSTVAAMLADLGAVVVDADALSRGLTAVDGVAMPSIAKEFGNAMVLADGSLNRDSMRALVFHTPAAKEQLQTLLHPLIQEAIKLAVAHAFKQQGASHVVCDIPLLVESAHWRQSFNTIWVVDCDEHTQMDRVVARSLLCAAQVTAIMANQTTRTQRNAAADVLIYNQGISLEDLRHSVQSVANQLGLS
jgi:dephospho-CoA kinase